MTLKEFGLLVLACMCLTVVAGFIVITFGIDHGAL